MKLYCKCIYDGYMEDGDIFCKKGEIYSYIVKEGDQQYPIVVYNRYTKEHNMTWTFFNAYFEDFKNEMFTEKDFKI